MRGFQETGYSLTLRYRYRYRCRVNVPVPLDSHSFPFGRPPHHCRLSDSGGLTSKGSFLFPPFLLSLPEWSSCLCHSLWLRIYPVKISGCWRQLAIRRQERSLGRMGATVNQLVGLTHPSSQKEGIRNLGLVVSRVKRQLSQSLIPIPWLLPGQGQGIRHSQ